jgi:glutamate dehydrogenase/leucine dehydrogenase
MRLGMLQGIQQTQQKHCSRDRLTACQAEAVDFRSKPASEISVAVFGSTGYIGRKVTEEMIARGFKVTPVAREQSGIGGKQSKQDVQSMFPQATCKFTDVTDASKIQQDVFDTPVDVAVCCLASRTGGIKDSWLIDYQVSHLVLEQPVWCYKGPGPELVPIVNMSTS